MSKRRVIYTCITGGYERLVDPPVVLSGYDYVCFSDVDHSECKVWKIYPIPDCLKYLPPVKQQREIKICPHKYLSEYDESLYIDGSIEMIGDVSQFINVYCNDEDKCVFIRKHPMRDCIYDEAKECIRLHKDTKDVIEEQMSRYESQNYPHHKGLVESGIMYRRHNDERCKRLMESWSDEVMKGSCRDQLSFNYCLWKLRREDNGFKEIQLNLFDNKYFKWYYLHNR